MARLDYPLSRTPNLVSMVIESPRVEELARLIVVVFVGVWGWVGGG